MSLSDVEEKLDRVLQNQKTDWTLIPIIITIIVTLVTNIWSQYFFVMYNFNNIYNVPILITITVILGIIIAILYKRRIDKHESEIRDIDKDD